MQKEEKEGVKFADEDLTKKKIAEDNIT